jgi:hypothetical protein
MSYTHVLGNIAPSLNGARRASDILAALAPPPQESTPKALAKLEPKPQVRESAAHAALGLAPGLVGAAIGAVAWKNHRVLGALAGHALASNVYPIVRGGPAERTRALCGLGVEAAGIGGALLYPAHPVVGWLGGVVVGAVVTSFVPGSGAQEAWEKIKAGIKK